MLDQSFELDPMLPGDCKDGQLLLDGAWVWDNMLDSAFSEVLKFSNIGCLLLVHFFLSLS